MEAENGQDNSYFMEKAHQFMQTWSKASYMNKMKGFYRAFGGANDHTDPKLAAKVMHANPHIEPKNKKFKV